MQSPNPSKRITKIEIIGPTILSRLNHRHKHDAASVGNLRNSTFCKEMARELDMEFYYPLHGAGNT